MCHGPKFNDARLAASHAAYAGRVAAIAETHDVAYRALTGRLPFDAEAFGELLIQICTDPIPPPSKLHADLGPEVDRLLSSDVNPRDAKEAIGKAIVSQYHGNGAADRAADEFRRRASGADPDEIPDVMLSADRLDDEGRVAAPFLIKELGLETSTSNARRLIEQGGFNVGPNRQTITDAKALIYVSDGLIVRAGKRKIARIRLV